MRNLLFASAAALSMAVAPAALSAQEANAPMGSTNSVNDKQGDFTMSTSQQATYDAWPPDRQSIYVGWEPVYQEYYWTLDPNQQDAYWLFNDDQRAQIYELTPEQQAAAWKSINQQMAARSGATTTASSTSTTMAANTTSGNIKYQSGAVVQNAPAPHQGEYPVCKSDADDNCINAWAAGQRGPGVDKPLDYWPGKPASES